MFSMLQRSGGRAAAFLTSLLAAAALASCGGGGGSPGATGVPSGGGSGSGNTAGGTSGVISLVMTDSSGAPSNAVTGANPLVAKATVKDSKGLPVKNVIVTFTASDTIVVLSPSTGTALTDANGVASIGVKSANTNAGAVEITAKAQVDGADVTAKAAVSVGVSNTATPAAINFTSATPSDKSIVIKGSGGNGRTEVALMTFRVVDSSNSGVPNANVLFSTQSSKPVSLTATSGKTDANGNVTVAVNSGTEPTTLRVIATVEGTSISALSDSVTVTTGQPTQAAFSLAVEKFYIEGANIDNIPNKLTVLLADAFGGAVADGTQVVFLADSGAIVGTGGAACLTVKGECSVTWRSQNPRSASGVVTVTATATNATTNLSTSASFYSSGSFPAKPTVSPDSTVLTVTAGAADSFDYNCAAGPTGKLTFVVADSANNPLPIDTALSITNATNVTATVSPAKVGWEGKSIVGGSGGTTHTVTLTAPTTTCAGTTGSFTFVAKTPLGSDTPYTYTVKFK